LASRYTCSIPRALKLSSLHTTKLHNDKVNLIMLHIRRTLKPSSKPRTICKEISILYSSTRSRSLFYPRSGIKHPGSSTMQILLHPMTYQYHGFAVFKDVILQHQKFRICKRETKNTHQCTRYSTEPAPFVRYQYLRRLPVPVSLSKM
jgi:hypothetical protein